jgi:hypothetical protein
MTGEIPTILLYREDFSPEDGYAPYGAQFEGISESVGKGETEREAIIDLLQEHPHQAGPRTRKPVYTRHASELDGKNTSYVG